MLLSRFLLISALARAAKAATFTSDGSNPPTGWTFASGTYYLTSGIGSSTETIAWSGFSTTCDDATKLGPISSSNLQGAMAMPTLLDTSSISTGSLTVGIPSSQFATGNYVWQLQVTAPSSGTCEVEGTFGGETLASSSAPAGGSADPHLRLAYGGMTDFRGINDTFFTMLSAPGVNVAMKTNDAVFMIKHNRRVDGSFMTAFAVSAMSGEEAVTVRAVADRETGFHVTDQRGAVLARNGVWSNWTGQGVVVEQLMLTTSIRAHGWEFNATRKPVYNHVTGPRWRFDFTIRPLTPESAWSCFPHGIIGQSFDGSGLALLGKTDDYDSYDVKTAAMAEGAIEGTAQDYVVVPPKVDFKFSRFHKQPYDHCKPRESADLSGRRFRGHFESIAGASD